MIDILVDIFDELLLAIDGIDLGGVCDYNLFVDGLFIGDGEVRVVKVVTNLIHGDVLGDSVCGRILAEVDCVYGTDRIYVANAPDALACTVAPVLHLLGRMIAGLPVGPGSIIGWFLLTFSFFGDKGAVLEHRLGQDGYNEIVRDVQLGAQCLLIAVLNHVNVLGDFGPFSPIA